VKAQAIDPALGADVPRLLEKEGNLLLSAKIVNFGCPLHLHAMLIVKPAAHPADGNPSNSGQVNIGYAFHKRLDAEKSHGAGYRAKGVDALV
jgi:hypothetical protein